MKHHYFFEVSHYKTKWLTTNLPLLKIVDFYQETGMEKSLQATQSSWEIFTAPLPAELHALLEVWELSGRKNNLTSQTLALRDSIGALVGLENSM